MQWNVKLILFFSIVSFCNRNYLSVSNFVSFLRLLLVWKSVPVKKLLKEWPSHYYSERHDRWCTRMINTFYIPERKWIKSFCSNILLFTAKRSSKYPHSSRKGNPEILIHHVVFFPELIFPIWSKVNSIHHAQTGCSCYGSRREDFLEMYNKVFLGPDKRIWDA